MQVSIDEFSWLFEGLPTYTTLQEKGLRLYDLGAFRHAQQFLQLPAAVGDAQAQFALASILERDPSDTQSRVTPLRQALAQVATINLPEDARAAWVNKVEQQIRDIETAFKAQYMPLYEAAAAQGNLDAMLRLGGEPWHDKIRQQLAPGVQANEGEALLNMYALTRDLAWLTRPPIPGMPSPCTYWLCAMTKTPTSTSRAAALSRATLILTGCCAARP